MLALLLAATFVVNIVAPPIIAPTAGERIAIPVGVYSTPSTPTDASVTFRAPPGTRIVGALWEDREPIRCTLLSGVLHCAYTAQHWHPLLMLILVEPTTPCVDRVALQIDATTGEVTDRSETFARLARPPCVYLPEIRQ